MKKNERYQKFADEAVEAGFEVKPYQGRFGYTGPAVECETKADFIALIRATTMNLQWDQLGYGFIVYPT